MPVKRLGLVLFLITQTWTVQKMVKINEPLSSSYSSRQRGACATLAAASTLSLTSAAAMANVPTAPTQISPAPVNGHVPQSHIPAMPGGVWRNTNASWQAPYPGHSTQTNASGAGGNDHGQTVHQAVHSFFHGLDKKTNSVSTLNSGAAGALNLASANQNFVGGSLANFKELTIQVGSKQEVVSLGTKLTAAEVVAAQQVLTGGTQTIKLGSNGTATGGTISLNSNLLSAIDNSIGGSIGSLTVSHGVKLVDTLGLLSISGGLINYGSIMTASSAAGGSDSITAGNIVNGRGGAIGSYAGGATSTNNLFAADPSLTASTSLTNNGTISSAGSLTINAPMVYNAATHGSGTTTPAISASQNVNLNTANLNNSGTISAITGNVNVASTAGLAVDTTNGTIKAVNGNINLSANNADLNVTGGNWISQQINLDAGTGKVATNLGEVTGQVNASADSVHINAETPNLILGNIDVSGDPLFTNPGNMTIAGTIAPTNGSDLTLIAGGNIVFTKSGDSLDTSSASGNGGNLTLIAGANFSLDGSNNALVSNSINAGKGSTTGGYIDLAGTFGGDQPLLAITTSSSAGSAGYIQMIAYNGASNNGQITAPTGITINASSTGGSYGNVSMIAGATSGTGVNTGQISGNQVSISTFTPNVPSTITFDHATGTSNIGITGFTTTGTSNNALVSVGNISTTGGVTITSGNTVTTSNILGQGAGGTSASRNGGTGQSVTITAGNSITTGIIDVSGGGGAGGAGGASPTPGGVGGNGGIISLTSTVGNISFDTLNVSGGGGGGGSGSSELSGHTAGGRAGKRALLSSRRSLAVPALPRPTMAFLHLMVALAGLVAAQAAALEVAAGAAAAMVAGAVAVPAALVTLRATSAPVAAAVAVR